MKNPIGIMQGRLSPPSNGKIQSFPWKTWEQEFLHAQDIGLNLIDWVIEADRFAENPLVTTKGAKTIKSIIDQTGVRIAAVCADYFMDRPLLRCSRLELQERLKVLELLIDCLNHLKIKYMEIPFVDNSAIKDKTEINQLIKIITPFLNKAHNSGVIFAFETSLPPKMFSFFLSALNHPSARANYDMGNSASLGYNPKEELEIYGDFVVTVHVKDRILKGGTVPLGHGNADLANCFSILRAKKYEGPFILQVARGNDEIEWARNNLSFVKRFLKE